VNDKVKAAAVPARRGITSIFWLRENDPTPIVIVSGVNGYRVTGPRAALDANPKLLALCLIPSCGIVKPKAEGITTSTNSPGKIVFDTLRTSTESFPSVAWEILL
jgi:hypothetical protein